MTKKPVLLFTLFILTAAAFAQDAGKGDFWIALSGDGALYATSGIAYGGGVSLGYGSGSSIGFKGVWYFSEDDISVIELSFFFRLYFRGAGAYSGPFIQLTGGPTFYSFPENVSIPSELGMISAGVCLGWRFLFLDRLFIEPAIRGGYPYVCGAGISAGIRF